MKVVINRCFGGFSLSTEAMEELAIMPHDVRRIKRNDPRLVEVVERLGERANGNLSKLKVVEIPDDIEWEIDEYDGMECVREVHRVWE